MLRSYFSYSEDPRFDDAYRDSQEAFVDGSIDMLVNMLNTKMKGNVKLGASAVMMKDTNGDFIYDDEEKKDRLIDVLAFRFGRWNDVGDKVNPSSFKVTELDIGGEDKINYVDIPIKITDITKSDIFASEVGSVKAVVDNRVRDKVIETIKNYTDEPEYIADTFIKCGLVNLLHNRSVLYSIEANDGDDLISLCKPMQNNDTVVDVKAIVVFECESFMIALSVCEVTDADNI